MADLFLYVARTPAEVTHAVRFLRGQAQEPALADMPAVWVGTASWLKADLFSESEAYIPDALRDIEDIVGNHLPVVDEVLIEYVRHALRRKNTTPYPLADAADVVTFMDAQRGHRAFTVRWK